MTQEQEWFKCNYCGKEFLTKQRMEDHRKVIHLGDGSKFAEGCLWILFKFIAILFAIAIIAFGAISHYEYHKQLIKEAIQEERLNETENGKP